jgi:ribosomal protein S18 acetylase RimI-like enzyme
MSKGVELVPLTRSARDVRRFLQLPYAIYARDPWWVAPLLMDVAKVFGPRNPLFEHAEMQLWIARRDGRDAGRIMGLVDQNHNRQQKDKAAFFGFFECIDDPEVSGALFEAVFGWARGRGLTHVFGPANPTTNDECGLLVDGFDASPVFMMPYNPRYYVPLVEAAGFRKAKDLLAFHFALTNTPMARFERLGAKFARREPEIRIRPIRRRDLLKDLGKVKEVYNLAWEDNWGFVPMTDSEIDFMAERLKPLLMEGLVYVAETPTEPVGFLLAAPDYNEAFKPLRGRLANPRLLAALPLLMGWKQPRIVRVLTLGVKRAWRGRGIEAAMLVEGLRVGFKAGFKEVEASWILEDNIAVQRIIGIFGGTAYKTYRIYDRDL